MNQKKSSSESLWVREEIQALRSDEPNPDAIDQTVNQVLAFSAAAPRKRAVSTYVWRAVPLAAGLGAGAFLLLAAPRAASAASLREVADALRHQSTRHSVTYRPGDDGSLVVTNEDWVDGARYVGTYIGPDGVKTLTGYDGARMFVYSTKDGGFIDDVQPSGLPVESIDSYLNIPGARVVNHVKGGAQDVYTVVFSTVRFDLYVDPASRLPIRRDVLSRQGRLIERNRYEYPSAVPNHLFAPPADPGLTDYPATRRELTRRLSQTGQTKEVGGVKITLKAVIVGKSKVLALWTGGAPAEQGPVGGMWIENMPKPILGACPEAFMVRSTEATGNRQSPPTIGGRQLLGDGAWCTDLKADTPFTINVPVWAQDSSRPIRSRKGELMGYHSKLAGRLTFRVTDPIRAADPDRVVWKPVGGAVAIATTEPESPKP